MFETTDLERGIGVEEASGERAATLQLVVDNIPGLVFTMTPAGDLEFVNRQVLDYFGGTLDELRNWTHSDALHPDDLPQVIAAWKHSLETGEPYEIEQHRIRRADGVYRWFSVRVLPGRDSNGQITRWYSLLTDTDERKQAEERLRRNETRLLQAQEL